MSQRRDVFTVDTDDALPARVAVIREPSEDLLGRALIGWERFLGTLRGVSDE
ncbi:hypothetical protein Snoj_77190 [Streptomyces nojiriensis]|uniref:Uncharacterized protein n=1 Tax=Streptomyces nojiriensis TaxID=66374 RepID=A0ABQ3T0A4_9ACTN|nr:hypothetical protein JYK04_05156 [Streptomyces nojiriensis]GGR79297.1 hypothetical protein GCM10010205_05120 [Streptomyces nojiriensis]GHI73801.1 hypothetical protein Snoj_77190 [Streptomyces nojiriensis]